MSSVISDKHFHDEKEAYAYVEARIWPNGPVCPHCGNADSKRITKLAGESTRIGVHKCKECRKPFTVKVGTVFESSHVPLRLWLQAIHLLCSSKKGMSSNQLHRVLGVTLKTAWFMSHRIREAMRSGDLGPMGGDGGVVEVDETYIGKVDGIPVTRGGYHKHTVLSLVERGGKRGMKGIYQHCGEKHLHRYLAEFDFRYNNRVRLGINDVARADRALTGAVGKRLTTKQLVTEKPYGKNRKAKAKSEDEGQT